MILGIDTTERTKIYLTIYNDKIAKCFELECQNQSADLLLAIGGILKKEKKTLRDLEAILVNRGPGSFTGVRVGITVGNTLAWSLNIPILGYEKGKESLALKKIKKLPKTNFLKIALPYYQ